jgi:hypothetical protein
MANGDTTEQYEQDAVDGEKVVTCPIACIGCGDDFEPWLAERLHVPAGFRGLLTRALADVAVEKRIVLESGAGIAVVFLTDPGQCLVFGLALREELRACSDESLRLRIGMHLGPVRIVRAADGEPQFLGDGLETGWRVASRAGPAQILATASFFDAIALQSSPYTDYFAGFGTMKAPSRCEQTLYCLEGTVPALHRAKDHVQIAGDEGPGAAHKIGSLADTLGTHLLRRPAIATALAVAFVLVLAVVLRHAVQNEAVRVEARAPAANPADQPPPSQQAAAPALQNKRTAPDHTLAGEPASQQTPTLQSPTATIASVNASAPGVATPPESVPDAAEQMPQRQARTARGQIPKGDVDAGDRLGERPRLTGLERQDVRAPGEFMEGLGRGRPRMLDQHRRQERLDQTGAVLGATGRKIAPDFAVTDRAVVGERPDDHRRARGHGAEGGARRIFDRGPIHAHGDLGDTQRFGIRQGHGRLDR